MTYKLIIFDLDGTLLNTIEDIASSVNYSLAKLNLPQHSVAEYPLFVGEGIRKLLGRVLPTENNNEELITSLHDYFSHHYSRNWAVKTTPYPGIPEVVNLLYRKRVKLAVLSNKPHEFAEEMTNYFFPEKPFEFIYGERKEYPVKPNPTVACEISARLGIDKNECILIGDSDIDIFTGRNAEMFRVGAAWGFRGRQELLNAGADLVIDNPFELIDFLKENKSLEE